MTDPAGDTVGLVLAALADPTRRAIFERVSQAGPLTATNLAAELPVSRQAISKHLDQLAGAGLVVADRVGRETRWSTTPRPLVATTAWLEEMGAAWDRRLGALAERASGDATGRR